MKLNLIALFFCAVQFVFSQNLTSFESEIEHVTVYTQGAEIKRKATLDLQEGIQTVHLVGLSSYLKEESVRLQASSNITILSVQLQQDYFNKSKDSEAVISLKQKQKTVKLAIEENQTWIKITNQKLAFVEANRFIGGKNEVLSLQDYTQMNTAYASNVEKLHLDLLKYERALNALKSEQVLIDKQLSEYNETLEKPSSTIVLQLEVKKTLKETIGFSYLVENASWEPSYNITYKEVSKPISITYKANIIQNTGVDWEDVKVSLSNAKTNVSGALPDLSPFYLRYYQPLPNYARVDEKLKGRIAGVQIQEKENEEWDREIQIRGVGSVSGNSQPLVVVDGVPMNGGEKALQHIDPDDIVNTEILRDAASASIYGSRGANGVILVTTKNGFKGVSMPLTVTTKRETTQEYLINKDQTILSNAKIFTLKFKELEVDASYTYRSVPKLSPHVYLVGQINEWYKTALTDGDVNVYFDNSYVGKSKIDTSKLKDTLDISFGVDNRVSVKREKLRDFSETKFIGANKKETIAFKITIQNNKQQLVSVSVSDQVPISTSKATEVEVLEISNANQNVETGELVWNLDLQPNEIKELIIKYEVKYPKSKKILLD